MKTCPNCASSWDDDAAFCSSCGTSLASVEPTAINEAPAPAAEPTTAPETVSNESASYFAMPEPEEPVEVAHKRAKNRKPLIITLTALFLAAAIVVVGALTNWFGLVSPFVTIGNALTKTLKANSLTFTLKTSENFGFNAKGRIVANDKKEELTFLGEFDNHTYAIFEGDLYCYNDDHEYGYQSDASEIIDTFFEAREKLKKTKKVDWEEILEEANLEDYLEADEMDGLVKGLYKNFFNNQKWLKDAMGYKKSGNTYTFEPDLAKVVESIGEYLLDSEALTDEAADMLEYSLDFIDDYLDKLDNVKITISFKISAGGYLEEIQFSYKSKSDYGTQKASATLKLSKTNSTKITEKEINKVIDKVEEYEN